MLAYIAKQEEIKKAAVAAMAEEEAAEDDIGVAPKTPLTAYEDDLDLIEFKMVPKQFGDDPATLPASAPSKRAKPLPKLNAKSQVKQVKKNINVFGFALQPSAPMHGVITKVNATKPVPNEPQTRSISPAASATLNDNSSATSRVGARTFISSAESPLTQTTTLPLFAPPSLPPPLPVPPPLPFSMPPDIPQLPDSNMDALDAFMTDMTEELSDKERLALDGEVPQIAPWELQEEPETERFFSDEDELDEEDIVRKALETKDPQWAVVHKGQAKRELKPTDHSRMEYEDFRKAFYLEAPEVASQSKEEVNEWRLLEEVECRGKNIPNPVQEWSQCGLSRAVLAVIEHEAWAKPFPIQCQTLPIIMSGRDCIGIAKTGSGKTLAFVLPMLRHVMDQRPIEAMEGPIAVIMAPTRELCLQIFGEVRRFAKVLELRVVSLYGGGSVAEQIGNMKKGCEIVVATPGRFIDVLCANAGRVTNLHRVTYLVLDEADRMFDMGFEPQVMKILDNVRPNRQTVMFSATFPPTVERLAKLACENPVEIVVGGRSVATSDIQQIIEVRAAETKFRRLLAILGKWYQTGNIIIFVDQQEHVDNLFRQLVDSGYPCLSLHGGMDQTDRDYTISDFKNKLRTILVATSIVARGLDVKDLVLVINYTVPNHYEDYVHRIGRTGRAGTKGTAITFLEPDQDKYAPDLVKGLTSAGQSVPADLEKMANEFMEKRKLGIVKFSANSGYGGSGFAFDASEENERKNQLLRERIGGLSSEEKTESMLEQEARAREQAGAADEKKSVAREKKTVETPKVDLVAAQLKAAKEAAFRVQKVLATPEGSEGQGPSLEQVLKAREMVKVAQETASALPGANEVSLSGGAGGAKALAEAWARKNEIEKKLANPASSAADAVTPVKFMQGSTECYYVELSINEYPQNCRHLVTHKKGLDQIVGEYDVMVTSKGIYVPPGRKAQMGERPLYLYIEGKTAHSVTQARMELIRGLEEAARDTRPDQKEKYGKYTVV